MNGATERQNNTPKDMMRGMIGYFTLPESLQEEALKTTVHTQLRQGFTGQIKINWTQGQ